MNIFRTYKTFDKILPDYLEERRMMLGLRTYKGDFCRLQRFSRWLGDNQLTDVSLRKISNQDIRRFTLMLSEKLDKPTVQRYITSIRLLWKYALKIREVEGELPFDCVVVPKKRRDNSPALIPKEKFNGLLNDIIENDLQLAVAIVIEYFGFMRPRQEIRLLKTDDISLEKGYIKVRKENAKTGKERYITITPEMREVLIMYGVDKAPAGLWIFGKKGKIGQRHTGVNSLTERFNVFRDKHDISETVKLYSFKHTGITDMLNAGIPLITVQNQAGHDRLSSTQHYAKKYGGFINPDISKYVRQDICI